MQAVQLATALLALAAAATAFPGYGSSHASVDVGGNGGLSGGYEGHGGGHEDYYAYPEYKFDYGVHDPHTGDLKSHSESRQGHTVKGSYHLQDADGHIRTVHYTADKHTGFQAVVKKGDKVTVHGYGEQDEQNNAVSHAGGAGASHGGASYSQAINHGAHYGKAADGGVGYSGDFGHAQVSFGGDGHY